uniref:SUN domain-containing protein n=1 Tax=Sinocyclocheilus grahami TaxID=75366 RepID=A0A672R985_SINGR
MVQPDLSTVSDQCVSAQQVQQQISNLKSSISNLQSAQDLVKERVDAQDTLNIKVRVLLAHFNSFDVMNAVTYYSTNDVISSAAESRAIRLANKTPERSKLIGIDHSICVSEFIWHSSVVSFRKSDSLSFCVCCWAFRGSQGFLVISLSYPVRITHVTLEHLPKELSPTGRIDSAPKDFAVYVSYGKLLGTFTYDQDGEPIQTFKLAVTSEIYSMTELRILSNWGHLEYTCVYRFRVHGEPSFV